MKKLLTQKFKTPYVICTQPHELEKESNCSLIYLHNISSIEIVCNLLKQDVSIYLPDFKDKYPDIVDYLLNTDINDVYNKNLKPDDLLNIIEKIKIPTHVTKLLSNFNDLESSLIDKSIVHKKNIDNVLISKLFSSHDLYFYRGYRRTNEIRIDHPSGDHVESMILTEIFRQACIAASEQSLGKHEYFVPIKDTKVYKRFISNDKPLDIQIVTHKSRKHSGFCTVSFWQNNKCCLKGYIVGKIYSVSMKDHLAAG